MCSHGPHVQHNPERNPRLGFVIAFVTAAVVYGLIVWGLAS
jgi:hypothetical protein